MTTLYGICIRYIIRSKCVHHHHHHYHGQCDCQGTCTSGNISFQFVWSCAFLIHVCCAHRGLRPLLLRSSTGPCIDVWAKLPGLLTACPNHCSFLRLSIASKGSIGPPLTFLSCLTESFMRCVVQFITRSRLWHLVSKDSIRFSSSLISVSHTYMQCTRRDNIMYSFKYFDLGFDDNTLIAPYSCYFRHCLCCFGNPSLNIFLMCWKVWKIYKCINIFKL